MKAGLSNSPSSRCKSGFTIVEVLVAAAAVAVVLATLFLGLTFGFAITRAERENLRATQIILERLECVRLLTWAQLQNPAVNPPSFTNSFSSFNVANDLKYKGTVAITVNPPLTPASTYGTNLALVTVAVSWVSGSLTNTRTMSTLVSERGVQNYVFNN